MTALVQAGLEVYISSFHAHDWAKVCRDRYPHSKMRTIENWCTVFGDEVSSVDDCAGCWKSREDS